MNLINKRVLAIGLTASLALLCLCGLLFAQPPNPLMFSIQSQEGGHVSYSASFRWCLGAYLLWNPPVLPLLAGLGAVFPWSKLPASWNVAVSVAVMIAGSVGWWLLVGAGVEWLRRWRQRHRPAASAQARS